MTLHEPFHPLKVSAEGYAKYENFDSSLNDSDLQEEFEAMLWVRSQSSGS